LLEKCISDKNIEPMYIEVSLNKGISMILFLWQIRLISVKQS
jgi:hypothetical protein